MSAEKCGGTITFEIIENAAIKALEQHGRMPERIVSVKAEKLLRKIHRKAPNWNNWTTEAEIRWKARSAGITDEE